MQRLLSVESLPVAVATLPFRTFVTEGQISLISVCPAHAHSTARGTGAQAPSRAESTSSLGKHLSPTP